MMMTVMKIEVFLKLIPRDIKDSNFYNYRRDGGNGDGQTS